MPDSLSLNAYGNAYNSAGRSIQAVKAIQNLDSDGDSYTNEQEINRLYFPGNAKSNPAKPSCPIVEISIEKLKAMPSHTQFMLANTHKQQFDDYATYKGVKIIDLVNELNIDISAMTGITVFAPDGYAKTFSKEQITGQYPQNIFYAGLDDAGLGELSRHNGLC